MGDISPEDTEKELLLVTLPGLPPQQASIDEIHRRFPDVEVKWLVGAPHGLKAPEAEEGKKERLGELLFFCSWCWSRRVFWRELEVGSDGRELRLAGSGLRGTSSYCEPELLRKQSRRFVIRHGGYGGRRKLFCTRGSCIGDHC